MQERRKEQRWPAYLGGRAIFPHQTTADCLIRNTSTSGARLHMAQGEFLPEQFELMIPQRDATYHARACWRARDQVGVELQAITDAAVVNGHGSLSLTERLKHVERKNLRLKNRLTELT